MKWFCRKKTRNLRFEDAARFNWALDTNQDLREGMSSLAEQFPHMTEEAYTARTLELFRRAGLELTDEDLKMLLVLRGETDKMLLRKERKEK